MEKIVLNTQAHESVIWPTVCASCAANLGETKQMKFEVKVKKGIRAYLSGGTPKSISVTFCDNCARKMTKAKELENAGYTIGGGIFILAAFFHHPRNQQEMMGAGGLFWLCMILGWIGQSRYKRLLGVRIIRLSKDSWAFWFRNKTYAFDFAHLNQPAIEKA